MNDVIHEVLIRRARLREELKPVDIYMGEPPHPIEPDWLAITHATAGRLESFNLVFFRFDGTQITWEQFETLEIALDQAHAIVGVKISEWESCHIEITRNDGCIKWEEIH